MTKEEVKSLKNNTVVYYVNDEHRRCFADPLAWKPYIGLSDGYDDKEGRLVIHPMVPIECRWVHTAHTPWMPYKDFESETEWYKLPRGWSYDTKLFDIECRYPASRLRYTFDLTDRNGIQKAVDDGYYTTPFNIDHRVVEAEIDRDRYRIVKKAHGMMYNEHIRYSWYMTPDRIFLDYNEAENYANQKYLAEKKIADMTDEEYAKYDLERELKKLGNDYLAEKYRLAILKNFKLDGTIEFKHMNDVMLWRKYPLIKSNPLSHWQVVEV